MEVDEDENCFDSELLDCIEQEDNEAAQEILDSLDDPAKIIDNLGNTLLHYSSQYSNDDMTKYLINLAANIDAQNQQGKTPLLLAIEAHDLYNMSSSNLQTISNLLDANANMHICDNQGISPLRNVVSRKGTHLHVLILEYLSKECPEDSQQIASKLIEADCSIYVALYLKNAEVTKILLDKNITLEPPFSINHETILRACVSINYLENVRVLLDHGIDPNFEDPFVGTAMMAYSEIKENKNPEILQLLLDKGANPYKILRNIDTGYMQMVGIFTSCERDSIRVLLQNNVSLNERDNYGNTAIHYVIRNNKPQVFDEFEGQNFYVNARNNIGYTPILSLATENVNIKKIKFLLDYGADINVQTPQGDTLLMSLIRFSRRVSNGLPLQIAEVKDRQIVEYLLQRGADPQVIDIDGNTIFNLTIYPGLSLDERRLYAMESILAHLAMLESQGTPIKNQLLDRIRRNYTYTITLQKYRRQVEIMKGIIIWKTMTFHELLIGGEVKFKQYLRDYGFRKRLSRMSDMSYSPVPYFCYVLREKITRMYYLIRLKEKFVVTMSKVMGFNLKGYHVIFEQICTYLTEKDMFNFCQIMI